jgi:putative ABC transport system permease protein
MHPKAIAALSAQWKKYNADFSFEYNFLDEAYGNLYKSEQKTELLLNIFAAIAIFISCLDYLVLLLIQRRYVLVRSV